MDGPDQSEQTPFERHAALWTGLAKKSPFWAILSQPGAEEASWDAEAFFRDGRAFAEVVALHLKSLDLDPARDRALDFGCGLGRLTQAMALYFDRVDGVDVALPMIEGARTYNKHGSRCQFHHNTRLDLNFLKDSSFDFVL